MLWHICVFKTYSHPECLRRYGARQMMEGLRQGLGLKIENRAEYPEPFIRGSLTRKMVCKYLFSIRRESAGSVDQTIISVSGSEVGRGELIGGACESVLRIQAKTILSGSQSSVSSHNIIKANSSRSSSLSPLDPPCNNTLHKRLQAIRREDQEQPCFSSVSRRIGRRNKSCL